ncbi:telomere repeat binding factor family protein [Aspergillus mulundensis]|uniref:Putative Myb-like transcription factor n=1 Tax=Aspergillus mulundensis TaxID=1810919 RepID=A0A3D8SIW0_9EURO|nr:putative Myb-like transcription factor [Aspergillus mulundensis]RDW86212.1 putative Myb-like transcription factor [Aspergillus mulundensis]
MDPNGIYPRNYDESLIRELPHLRIAPLREPVSSRTLRIPLTLEPNASGIRDPNGISKPGGSAAGILPPRNNEASGLGIEGSGANTPRLLVKNDFHASSESLSEPQPPPRPILPAFVNLRALERFPYSSFDDDSHQSRKRRRVGLDVDAPSDSFGEHLQLPMPQAQKEQRPPPFGPFAILNGLNEPPPNAALLPPIEAGSITQLLTKPSRDNLDVVPEPEPTILATSFTPEVPSGERIEGRIADILDSPIAEKASLPEPVANGDKTDKAEPERKPSVIEKELQPAEAIESPPLPKTRGRCRKNLRKWSNEETVALLRGVMKCGIGNWKEVLAQDEPSFNKRTASNLKDRFRVCCPNAYRASKPDEALQHLRDALTKVLGRMEGDSSAPPGLTHSGSTSSFSSVDTSQNIPENHSQSTSVPERSQTLSNNKSEPAAGGPVIPQSYTPAKARRRSRRPFTAAEDEALLKGYAVHGFQWTLIQQDKELDLGHRRATDLRDRFRTMFPHAYRDGGAVRDSALQAQITRDAVLKDGPNPAASSKQKPHDSKPASTDSRPSKPVNPGAMGTVDPVLPSLALHPVTREGSTGVALSGLSFLLEEGPANDDSVDLPPLIWDDLP